MAERNENKKLIKWLDQHNFYYIKHNGGPFSRVGVTDFLICLYGLFVAIEMKRKGKKPTLAQSVNLNEVRNSMGISAWFDNGEEAVQYLENILSSSRMRNWLNVINRT